MNKYCIFGLPRSGTTILLNILNGIKNSIFLNEPHLNKQIHNKIDDLPDENLNCYFKNNKLPIDELLNRLRFKNVGFKETYRKFSLAKHIINIEILNNYKNEESYKKIFILRNPINNWNSWKHFNNKNENTFEREVICFKKNYLSFINDFIDLPNTILYENLLKDAINEIKLKTSFTNIDIIHIIPSTSKMGDHRAKNQKNIKKSHKKHIVSKKEESILKECLEAYNDAKLL